MNKKILYSILIFLIIILLASIITISIYIQKDNSGDNMGEIKWHGHATIQINELDSENTAKKIYIDPFELKEGLEKADIIFITHGHHDHCSIKDAAKISKSTTIVIATKDCIEALENLDVKEKIIVEPNNEYEVNGVKFETVPAYNTDKQFHPKTNQWVGYIITLNNKRYYHAGDTDNIPEFASKSTFANIDIAFMPVGGTYTMTAKEAAAAVNLFKPKLAIPMHYGTIIGKENDAKTFKKLCDCEVKILN
jgi:L-ascorbate metabolism protein UlaG (beta-lactamase superfamily)